MKPAHMAAMVLSALLVFYPLSVGPVFRAYYTPSSYGLLGLPDGLQEFYMPLAWICAHSRPIEKFFEWYLRIWMHGIEPNPVG